MPLKRSSSRTQLPAQRRPRTERACSFCRIAKQRCEPIEYGTNDRPCRRCVSQGLDCNLPRVTRSQSPGSGFNGQATGPIQHSTTPHSAGGTTKDSTPSAETDVRYGLQQSESVQAPMRRWSPLMLQPEAPQGPTPFAPEQTRLHVRSFLPATPGMESYQQSFPSVTQGCHHSELSYYPQDYYVQATPADTYMASSYATRSVSDDGSNLGFSLENPQPNGADTSGNEQDWIPSRQGAS